MNTFLNKTNDEMELSSFQSSGGPKSILFLIELMVEWSSPNLQSSGGPKWILFLIKLMIETGSPAPRAVEVLNRYVS